MTQHLYEGLFLINLQSIGGEISAAIDPVREVLGRAEADIVHLDKWDERKLAYAIEGQKRGLYVHSLFRAAPTKVGSIERDVNLSELILRVLVTRADHLGEEEIEQIKSGLLPKAAETAAVADDADL